jgi:hypothetical protein
MYLGTGIVLSNQFCKYYMRQLTEINEKLAGLFILLFYTVWRMKEGTSIRGHKSVTIIYILVAAILLVNMLKKRLSVAEFQGILDK